MINSALGLQYLWVPQGRLFEIWRQKDTVLTLAVQMASQRS